MKEESQEAKATLGIVDNEIYYMEMQDMEVIVSGSVTV